MYTLSPETIKYADRLASEKYGISGLTLMKNAAKSCYDFIFPHLSHDSRIVILCGKGNNGGDGYELSGILKSEWFDVTVINVFDTSPSSPAALSVFNECLECGVNIAHSDEYAKHIEKSDIIIDAVFGVGFYGKIESDSKIGKMIALCNDTDALRIAIDTPSGINSADGRVAETVFKADMTITMAYIKTGMLSYPAREYCGEILVADIGYPGSLCNEIPKDSLIADDEYIRSRIPIRSINSHKGTYGRLLMYCASHDMTGAAVLAANAALRSGVGLVNIARDEKTIRILQHHLTEPVFSVLPEECEQELLCLSKKATAVLIGCGMGTAESDRKVLYSLIKNADCNLIIDADGINLLCENKLILREAKKTPILTPHPLEFARLSGKSVHEVQSNRINLAKEFAALYGCVVVLKGASTVIASPDGKISVNTSGNPGLSKGGSGDVLAGLIASLCAQGINEFDCAILGAYLHGKAADILREEISEYGFLPSELPMAIAKLLP